MSAQSVIANSFKALDMGVPQAHGNLTLVPLFAREARAAQYITLDDGLEAGLVRIGEVSEHGAVPELSVMTEGTMPVLLLDGEELIGAKQNRVLNLTVLVAAKSSLVIPVSCVEARRWTHVSRHFRAAPRTQFAEGRAAKMRQVTESLQSHGMRRSDQGEVWRSIDEKAARLDAVTDTGAMSAVFERVEASVDTFVRAFPPLRNQVGAVFAINGRIVGLDLFDAPETWRKLGPKVIRSYGIDAIDRATSADTAASSAVEDASTFLARVADAQAASFPAIGLGDDVRLTSADVNGAALVVDGRAVHVSAFADAA